LTKNFLTHPVFRLALFGFLLACVILLIAGPPGSGDDLRRVVITDSDLEQLRISWYRRWQRSPTPEEMRGQLEQLVRQEVLYREALARGYDKDDPLVRRAMQQKMEFLGQAQAAGDTLTEEEIRAFFALRREQYRVPGAVSFMHVYYNLDTRGASAEADARSDLERLRKRRPDPSVLSQYGDRFLLQYSYRGMQEPEVRAEFGQAFADSVMRPSVGRWHGPVASGYGLHLVYVDHREESFVPELEQVRQRVVEDMQMESRNAARELFFMEILRSYQIVYRGEALEVLEGRQ